MHMRTTLDIQDQLLRSARRQAVEKRTTLTRVIEEALRHYLMPASPKERKTTNFRSQWVVVEGGAAPHVDIADRDRLYDLMDGRRP